MTSKEKIAKRVYNQSFKELCSDKKRIVLSLLKLENVKIEESIRFVEISKNALIFSKLVLALFYLIALVYRLKFLLIITLILIIISIIVKSKKDPLVILYSYTIDKLTRPRYELMDLNSLRFANSLSLFINIIALLFLYLINPLIGWIIVLIMLGLKIASAAGFCGGVKLYSCMNNGCCMIKKKK